MNLDISTYQKINNSFRKRLIYHSGIDCGFFVELNYMINAMLYCLAKGYRFQLYSEDANYGTGKGWIKIYSGIQIRGGDKAQEAQLITGKRLIEALHPQDGDCIFALADNYTQLEIVRNEFPHLHIVSLCQPQEKGYFHQEFNRMTPLEKKQSIIRLLASMDILLHSSAFIGTITSGPSVFIMKVRAGEFSVTAIDCPQAMFPDCLSLCIDERAAISCESAKTSLSSPSNS